MPRRRIQAHYEQLSEFESGRIIELKEAGWANRRTARLMGRSDATIRRCRGARLDKVGIMLTEDVQRLVTNPTSNCVLAIIEDVSGDAMGSPEPSIVIRGTFTAQRYVDDILRTVLLPLLLQYPCFIFQQDNARQHKARVAMNCLTACQTLPWPATSPDLSAIEHVWDTMGRLLHLPGNVDDLAPKLEEI
ncbi:transposable element Tc1 transposase [Trichonephila clavipes]|nr:transposable element Tc1 transposase [Trichonephila clavipes]